MNNFTLNLFSIQQSINNILIEQITTSSGLSFVGAFLGGLFTSIGPCVLGSIPIATLYINQRSKKVYNTVILTGGIATSLLSIGAISIFIKQYTWSFIRTIPLLWPILLTIIGLNLLDIMPFTLFNTSKHDWHDTNKNNNIFYTYFLGFALGITISPCSTPITITILAWITTTQQYINGLYLLLMYTVGYITPLILSILSLNNFQRINILSKKSYIITNVLGFTTISIGSYSLFKELFVILPFDFI
uniref:Thiol:disulfi de interchange protein n=1 Tax=Neoizziella asiatica TaxID=1077397 RepID=A0A1G4NWP6_9FLOR|nr:Thiol:disulfi de interchange protein [Neoizziella asiatica]SCW23090.1 Thiol:disulfi de interchange protein [Neoizziella asiatica]